MVICSCGQHEVEVMPYVCSLHELFLNELQELQNNNLMNHFNFSTWKQDCADVSFNDISVFDCCINSESRVNSCHAGLIIR